MTVDARAGKPPDPSILANIPRLMTAYYTRRPDPSIREQRVTFGTSGSSAQRVRWFRAGLDSGDVRQCNTFATARP
jgi:Putative neutral zinc metallopeptidase